MNRIEDELGGLMREHDPEAPDVEPTRRWLSGRLDHIPSAAPPGRALRRWWPALIAAAVVLIVAGTITAVQLTGSAPHNRPGGPAPATTPTPRSTVSYDEYGRDVGCGRHILGLSSLAAIGVSASAPDRVIDGLTNIVLTNTASKTLHGVDASGVLVLLDPSGRQIGISPQLDMLKPQINLQPGRSGNVNVQRRVYGCQKAGGPPAPGRYRAATLITTSGDTTKVAAVTYRAPTIAVAVDKLGNVTVLPAPVTIAASELKRDGTDWQFAPGPATPPKGTITAGAAVEAAMKEPNGKSLTGDTRPAVALVYFTNALPKPQAAPGHHRLAWIIQLDNVPIAASGPLRERSRTRGAHTADRRGTAQWVIDATTGAYVAAHDWG